MTLAWSQIGPHVGLYANNKSATALAIRLEYG
jgi:hypothetical protein